MNIARGLEVNAYGCYVVTHVCCALPCRTRVGVRSCHQAPRSGHGRRVNPQGPGRIALLTHLGEVSAIALVPKKGIIYKTIDTVEFCTPHSGPGQGNLRQSRANETLHGRICYPALHYCYLTAGVTSRRRRAVGKMYRFDASSGCSWSPTTARCQSQSLWSSQGIDAMGNKKWEWSTQLSSADRRKTPPQQREPRPRPRQPGQRSPPS